MFTTTARIAMGVVALALAAASTPAVAGAERHDYHGHENLRTVTDLDGPRGVDALGHGMTLVTETGGDFSLVIERKYRSAKVIRLGNLATEFPPAIARGRHGTVYLLTGASGPPEEEPAPELSARNTAPGPAAATTLFKWRPGWHEPKPFVDIGAYQAGDLDPYDQEGIPEESNPFGLAALRDGSVLVADAAGNDLLRVWPNGSIKTVARFKPRLVETPEGVPGPPPGTVIPAESVPTSVTVGKDGYWYVGELRGFPATPGTSQIWRIKPGAVDATCDPTNAHRGPCQRYADGLTSVIDLASGHRGIYALELSKLSWLQAELGAPGSEYGGLFLVKGWRGHTWKKELVRDQLITPGGVDAAGGHVYVTGPIFGPGALMKIH